MEYFRSHEICTRLGCISFRVVCAIVTRDSNDIFSTFSTIALMALWQSYEFSYVLKDTGCVTVLIFRGCTIHLHVLSFHWINQCYMLRRPQLLCVWSICLPAFLRYPRAATDSLDSVVFGPMIPGLTMGPMVDELLSKKAATLETKTPNSFPCTNCVLCWFKFHWKLFLKSHENKPELVQNNGFSWKGGKPLFDAMMACFTNADMRYSALTS